MALGLAGFTAGTFHLMTHAFFKALLFLGAGSVIHAVHTNDIQFMGGLSKKMKITSITFLIASLSISGIFPLSGFWSKDEIFAIAYEGGHYIFLLVGILVAGMTAFYMFRLYFLTFTGKPRDKHAYEHAHESHDPGGAVCLRRVGRNTLAAQGLLVVCILRGGASRRTQYYPDVNLPDGRLERHRAGLSYIC
jgi:NADH:ubiquinone oxidoreductase subunit 5 (subunit L)/multisubunit Na+/H+ antiporter MnhA subunit